MPLIVFPHQPTSSVSVDCPLAAFALRETGLILLVLYRDGENPRQYSNLIHTPPNRHNLVDLKPFQIVSLLDMVEFPLAVFADLYLRLSVLQGKASEKEALTSEEQAGMIHWMETLTEFCANFEMEVSYFTGRAISKVRTPSAAIPTLDVYIGQVRAGFENELRKGLFMFMPAEQAKLYNKPGPLPWSLNKDYEEANKELVAANNCYATNNGTACVFHAIRAVEYGLRSLAKRLRVRLPKKRHIDLEEWGNLIKKIEDKIVEIENKRRTKKREADLEFYHGAASQFRHFKNAWRNHCMHSRASYELDEAAIVLRHVIEFMKHIAPRLGR